MAKSNNISNQSELELIAERLRELRKAKGYKNYEHFAYELGMSRSAYWRIEKGSNFEMKTLFRIYILLGITVQEFFTVPNTSE
jgi:transcriptional regulator with XRE-family HTH domain